MAIKINSNKESEYEDGQLKDALLSLALYALVVGAFFLFTFIVYPRLGYTTSQAALMTMFPLIIAAMDWKGTLLAFGITGVILMFWDADFFKIITLASVAAGYLMADKLERKYQYGIYVYSCVYLVTGVLMSMLLTFIYALIKYVVLI